MFKKFICLAALLTYSTTANAKVDLEVDRSDLQVTIKQDGKVVDIKPLAMGKPGSPTPLGTYKIRAIDINPGWMGTRGQGYVPPGPSNPLGRVRMRYDMPYALHGTNNPNSIGTYASLGCIRMYNEDVIELAELIIKDSGNWGGSAWFNSMLSKPTKMFHLPLRNPVTITIKD